MDHSRAPVLAAIDAYRSGDHLRTGLDAGTYVPDSADPELSTPHVLDR